MSVGDLASVVLAATAVGSLLYISLQVRVTRQQTKGQFLLSLDDQFQAVGGMMLRVLNEPDFKPTGNEWIEVWKLMSVFERIAIMVEDKILDIGIVDRLHGFKLVGIIANDEIYRRLRSTGAEWQDFIDLCYSLANHRRKRGHSPGDAAFIERVRALDKATHDLPNPFGTRAGSGGEAPEADHRTGARTPAAPGQPQEPAI